MFWLNKYKETDKKKFYNSDVNFPYLGENDYYFDSACQTLRPQAVIEAQNKYYSEFNSCGGRVKYPWGERLDELIYQTRRELLKMVKKSERDYAVAFGLNSTHLINLILMQLKPELFSKIITTEIEHNSVFLPSIVWARQNKKQRVVLERELDGTVILGDNSFEKTIFIANTTSNIDGRKLENLSEVTRKVKLGGGLLLLDACQSFAHDLSTIETCDFDACFGSGHKMYAPSMGFVIFRKDLIKKMNLTFIGGSTVSDTRLDDFDLVSSESELFAVLEAGLQNYGGIVGCLEAIKWLNSKSKRLEQENTLSQYLFTGLNTLDGVNLLNKNPSSTVSLYFDKIDSHKLAAMLSAKGIMCRTGYHCCHYYLKHKMQYPPLLRISLGENNNHTQIDFLLENLKTISKLW
jgi:selenocysteine lyase/cysteine desulfurase